MNRPHFLESPRRLVSTVCAVLGLLAGCAGTPSERAGDLSRQGRYAEALALLDAAPEADPQARDARRATRLRIEQTAVAQWLAQAERARAAGRLEEARALLQQAATAGPLPARGAALQRDVERSERLDALVKQAQDELRRGRKEEGRAALDAVLREAPGHAAARALLAQMTPAAPVELMPRPLAEALRKSVTLEFRDAPLKSVFEALARGNKLNFVFDREVRGDGKVTLFLRDIALEEALAVLLSTQQLERKALNANTLLIYPATPAKQREHQELVTRTIYLTNADVKTTAALIRTIAKTQDVHVDERLNAIVVRESPPVIGLIEDLVAAVDLPEAEVMIEVEVLEVASAKLDDAGIQWPQSVSVGLINADGTVPASIPLSRDLRLRGSIVNPALVATLRATDGRTQTLANPTIRARNHEKAQVLVGDRLPVFTTTSTANVGVSTSVNYLDVGIKLDVEPSVQLDNEVIMKVTLEVSNLVSKVSGPAGSVAYQIGTRRISTALRLNDGETQMLAGLIKDEDRRSADGIPGLASLPVVGRLFGLHSDSRAKTEVVLLMTPRVIRNLPLPEARITSRPGGTAVDPGAAPLRLAPQASAGMGLVLTASGGDVPAAAAGVAAGVEALELSTTGSVGAGQTASVTLRNRSRATVSGQLEFDSGVLQNAAAGGDPAAAVSFELKPGGEQVTVLRVAQEAAGQTTQVSVAVTGMSGSDASARVAVVGSGAIEVRRGK